jgi:hypothetical protein
MSPGDLRAEATETLVTGKLGMNPGEVVTGLSEKQVKRTNVSKGLPDLAGVSGCN